MTTGFGRRLQRSSVFLIEQVMAITVFAVCAAVCAGVFAESYYRASDARDVNFALMAAKNGAEAYKAFGNTEEAAAVLGGGAYGPGEAAVYYDRNWRVCGESSAETAYVLRLAAVEGADAPLLCDLSVERAAGGELVSFTVAAKGGGRDG